MPFQGGVWESNPFLNRGVGGGGGGGGGYRQTQPQYDDYADEDPYDDYGPPPRMIGGRQGPGLMTYQARGGPMMGGNSHSYSSYQDSDGNMHEEGYGPNGPYRNSVRGGQGGGMGMGAGMPPQGRPPPGSLLGGRSTGRPGAFSSPFWTGDNPFCVNGANGGRGARPDGAFRNEVDPAPMREDRGLTQDSADDMAWFMQERTQPLGDGRTPPPNAECPICLEPPSASHLCVQIKGIEGCNHLIGRNCLKEMLLNRPDDQKRCPICRAEFLGEDGIWQDSEQFQQLTNGHNAGGRAPPQAPPQAPSGYGGGSPAPPPRGPPVVPPLGYGGPPQMRPSSGGASPPGPSSYGGPPRAAPLATPHAAPPGLRNAMRGGARVHGMGDVGMGRDDEQGGGPPMGGMQGGPPMMDDRGPPPPESNFSGRGERLGYMYPDQRW